MTSISRLVGRSPRSGRRSGAQRALALAALGLGLAAPSDVRAADDATREVMHSVYGALSRLLSEATSDSAWREPRHAADVQTALVTLESAAEQLRQHSAKQSEGFAFFSQVLARDARDLHRLVDQGRYPAASYVTRRMTETCIGCHVRLPSGSSSFSSGFVKNLDPGALSPLARARLQVALRQFDEALGSYEAQFASPDQPISRLESEVPAYLVVAVRVRRSPERAEKGLAILARRPDLSAQLEESLPDWQNALVELGPALAEKPSLDRSRRLLDQGQALGAFPADGADLVHGVVASAILHRFLEEQRPQGKDLAETLYLLARAESRIRRSFESSDSAHYLEQAIRTVPHTALAQRAYARLEQQTVLGYSGSAGEQLPDDVRSWLAELRELSRASAPARTPAPADAVKP